MERLQTSKTTFSCYIEMNVAPFRCSLAPSPATLRFLRIQNESLRLFSTFASQNTPRRQPVIRRHCELNDSRSKVRTNCWPRCQIRSASTSGTQVPGRERQWGIWRQRKGRESAPLEPNDLPSPLTGLSDEHSSLGRVLKSGNELKLRCTEFDETGRVTLVNGEFKKSELIQKVR